MSYLTLFQTILNTPKPQTVHLNETDSLIVIFLLFGCLVILGEDATNENNYSSSQFSLLTCNVHCRKIRANCTSAVTHYTLIVSRIIRF